MMTNRARRLLFLVVATCSLLVSVRAEPEILAKARSFLGSEAALDELKSIHYVGTLSAPESAATGAKNNEAAVEIIFQKSFRHRITTTTAGRVEVAGLDDYEGWQRQKDPANPDRWRLTLLTSDQIKRLRANTWENLSFFRGIEQQGGKTEDLGDVTKDGILCRKIAFEHAPTIVFFRYFDKTTGRLVFTETEQGGSIREEGEMMVDGIRFPKVIVTTVKGPDGKEVPVTVTLNKITINEPFPADFFSVPMLSTAQ